MNNIVPFPERDPGFKASDPNLLAKASEAAKTASELLANPNVTDGELEEAMRLLNDAWGVAAFVFIENMGEF